MSSMPSNHHHPTQTPMRLLLLIPLLLEHPIQILTRSLLLVLLLHHRSTTICMSFPIRSRSLPTYDSLVDRGANGGLAGSDMRLINYDLDRTIDVQGIDNHQVPNLRLGKFGAVAKTKKGNILLIFCQYAHIQNGKSIHSLFRWRITT